MLFGYARVSTKDQNLHMQFDALKKYGVEEKNIYSEKITGTKKDRPAFTEMMKYLRDGDTVVVYKLDRIGRSTKHLVDLINNFQDNGINFVSINENIDTTTAMGKLVFTIFSGLAQFERDIISERTKSGLNAARARGRKGGRPKKDQSKLDMAFRMYDSKEYSINEILMATEVSRATFYRYLTERQNLKPEH
ncbi:recombinase family protein [Halobacillus sp. Marseille-Q1614]|uniref:recombinase family protein n=1 Tax=Halobacillus sp. Marseille-Q1614 TaxID=2709134 RepID=UPI00156DE858|nr:recombinase family protein [Halobacillus sp. Marseille-Q1614]